MIKKLISDTHLVVNLAPKLYRSSCGMHYFKFRANYLRSSL